MLTNAFQFAGSIMTLITVLASGTFIQMPPKLRNYLFNESAVANKKKAINTLYFLSSLFYLAIGFCLPIFNKTGNLWVFSLENNGLVTLFIFLILVFSLVTIAVCISKKIVSRKYK